MWHHWGLIVYICVTWQPPVPYIVWDESFSTQEARESLWENDNMGKRIHLFKSAPWGPLSGCEAMTKPVLSVCL